VDSYSSAEQSGINSDSRDTDNGVSYLRRLKQQIEAERPSIAPAGAGPPPAMQHNSLPGKERRRSPRFRCSGSAEVTTEGSPVRMWGTLTDISLRGCYVEMSSTFPVDTRVELILQALGIRFRAQGTVRISYPFLGMGILITQITPDQRALLEQLLAALAKIATASNAVVTPDSASAHLFVGAEPIAFLNEIKNYFDTKAVLPREEFFRIAKRCQRS
jgi:hypothetical protein